MTDEEIAAKKAELDQGVMAFAEIASCMAKYHQTLIEGGIDRPVADRMVEELNNQWTKGTFAKNVDLGNLFGGG